MMPSMNVSAHLDHYRKEGAALAEAASLDLQLPVPSCPGWTEHDLLGHIGSVHLWALACLSSAPDQRPRFRDVAPPPEGAARVGWYLDSHGRLADELAQADHDRTVWSWAGPVPVRWWARRQVHEVTIHRWDAQRARGEPAPIDTQLAIDGIDEFLDVFVPRLGEKLSGKGESIHLHATDTDGEWSILRGAQGATVSRGHSKGEVAARASASDLLLLLWGRISPDDVDVFGDQSVLRGWLEVSSI